MRYILFALVIFISAAPLAAQAAPVDFFGPIIPEACHCENVQVLDGEEVSTAPGWGCVLQTVQNVIRLAITLGIVLATLALVYAGFVWMTSDANPDRRKQGRTLLINVFVGLFVMLSAWLIVDFVMKTFYREPTDFGPWNSILAGDGDDQCLVAYEPVPITTGTVDVVTGPPGGTDEGPGGGTVTSSSLTHDAALTRLQAAGISISSSGSCSDRNNSTCTSLSGMNENTIAQVIAIKEACGCSIVVTGGTETGHAGGALSHSTGFKIDLGLNNALNGYIQRLTPSGSRGGDPRYRDPCGNEYVRESDHWDITVSRGVCPI